MSKAFFIKIYRPTGEFITSWKDFSFQGFSKEINGGLGECIIELGREFDYSDGGLALGNHIDIFINNGEAVDGDPMVRVYAGYISMIEPTVDGPDERILVYCLGYHTLLSLDVLKNSTQTTLYSDTSAGLTTTSPASVADVGLVARTIIDRYRAETINPKIGYTLNSIPNAGQNINYNFEQKTYREALEKVKSSAPEGYYYYLNQDGVLSFKAIESDPVHKFIFGRHFSSVKVSRNIELTRNVALIFDGNTTYKQYSDALSISLYKRRVERIEDPGIADSGTMDLIGAKFIAENKDPNVKVVCEILDEKYDIESINPGDTCAFFNFDASIASIFKYNMTVSWVDYSPSKVRVVVEPVKSSIVDIQERMRRQITEILSSGIPETYS